MLTQHKVGLTISLSLSLSIYIYIYIKIHNWCTKVPIVSFKISRLVKCGGGTDVSVTSSFEISLFRDTLGYSQILDCFLPIYFLQPDSRFFPLHYGFHIAEESLEDCPSHFTVPLFSGESFRLMADLILLLNSLLMIRSLKETLKNFLKQFLCPLSSSLYYRRTKTCNSSNTQDVLMFDLCNVCAILDIHQT